MCELTINLQLLTDSDFATDACITCPFDLHVEGVSPGHTVDGQYRLACRTKGSRDVAVSVETSLFAISKSILTASYPSQ